MAAKAAKTAADYRERANRARALADTANSAPVRRALLNVAARYDELAENVAGSTRHKRTKRGSR